VDKKGFIAMISFLFFLHACGTLPETGQDFRSSGSSYERVFQSAVLAVDDIGFSVAESDASRGMIVAEKAVVDTEKGEIARRLNISIETAASGVKVEVTSNGQDTADEDDDRPLKIYVDALKKRAPAEMSVSH